MKSEKGITLIALVITIIILLILASIAVYNGLNSIRSSKYMVFKTEMQLLQSSIDEMYSADKDNLSTYGTDMTSSQKDIFTVTEVNNILSQKSTSLSELQNGFKYFSKDYIVNDLNIEGITRDYYINMSKRIIIATEPLEYEGVNYYMLEQMSDTVYNVEYDNTFSEVTFSYSTSLVNGKTGTIEIYDIKTDSYVEKWQVRYREKGKEAWNITNEFLGDSCEINVDKICDYEVQVFHGSDLESDIVVIPVGEPAEPETSDQVDIDKDYGVIEVAFLKGTTYEVTTIPNVPVLKDGMKAVYWDENGNEVTQGDSDFDITQWYNYSAQTTDTSAGGSSIWANAKVTVDGVDSYFVWIPRYAYRIVYFDTEKNEENYRKTGNGDESTFVGVTGYSDARGIVDELGRKPTEVASKRGISVNDKYFRPHPVFEKDVNEGGWITDEENPENLTGIWVAKYESSKGNNNKPVSRPNVSDWRDLTIGQMFTYAKNHNTSLNSHLLKASEWGAVAYLADSKYGRNGTEIAINNSSTYITGNSGGSSTASYKDGITYAYNTEKGGLASTTGNISGIYDMSGCAWEYIASYFNNANTSQTNFYQVNASSFASKGGTSDNFSTVYTGVELANDYIPGDATFEISGWNSDNAAFYSSNFPFGSRGGFYQGYENRGAEISGLFAYGASQGNQYNSDSFRVALIVQ